MATLFDTVMRHAIYLEGVKAGASKAFARRITSNLNREVTDLFKSITARSLGDMNKRDFNAFVADLRRTVSEVFNDDIRDFMRDTRNLSREEIKIFQAIFREDTGERIKAPAASQVWATIRNSTIPASGNTFTQQATAFRNSAVSGLERIARNAYADKLETDAVMLTIKGAKTGGGYLPRISAWGGSFANTVFHHAAGLTKDYVAKNYYEWYEWVSVLDEVTTDICIERHGQRYRYGEGPLPPAHYNCRSETIPVSGEDDDERPESFVEWLDQQPAEFLDDAFTGGDPDLDKVKVIKLDRFGDKIEFILI